jgi:isocitrate dehydrogenase
VANPAALLLSGAMMLEHMGLGRAGVMISKAIEETYSEQTMTADLARLCDGSRCVGTKDFCRAVLGKLG